MGGNDCRNISKSFDYPDSKGGPGFIKMIRNPELLDLLFNDQKAFRLLIYVAFTTNREIRKNMYGSGFGEAYVTAKKCGLSSQEFTSARKRLEKIGCAIFETRGSGRGQDVYGRLCDNSMFDLNLEGNGQTNTRLHQHKGSSIGTQCEDILSGSSLEVSLPLARGGKDNSSSKEEQSRHQERIKSPNKQELRRNNEEERDLESSQCLASERDKYSTEKQKKGVRKKQSASKKGLELAERLFEAIKKTHPGKSKPSSLDAWSIDIDRLMTVDAKEESIVKEVIDFLPKEPFWCKNVMSGFKLRKHFERLEQAKFEMEAKNRNPQTCFSEKIRWVKEKCRPFLKSPKVFFIFHHNHLEVVNKQKESSSIDVYFDANGFEDQFMNALRKVGVL